MLDAQSRESDKATRQKMVWEIDRKLQEEVARPIISHGTAAACWQPYVKNVVIMVNSIYNGWRFEDIWLDREKHRLLPFGEKIVKCISPPAQPSAPVVAGG